LGLVTNICSFIELFGTFERLLVQTKEEEKEEEEEEEKSESRKALNTVDKESYCEYIGLEKIYRARLATHYR